VKQHLRGQPDTLSGEIPMTHLIKISIDDDVFEVQDKTQTANQLLQLAGKDPANFYLVELIGHKQKSYKDNPNEIINLHEKQRFITMYCGGHTVSDGNYGVDAFFEQLSQAGICAERDKSANDRISFDFVIPGGKFAAQIWRIGLVIPASFPAEPPTGPHISPQIHGTQTKSGVHPTANISASPFGADWEYWSRPYPNWNTEPEKSARTYLKHIARLWVTQ